MAAKANVSTLLLRNVPLFKMLPEDQLAVLATVVGLKSFARGESIIAAGDVTDSLYVVIAGRLKVIIGDKTGREIILTMLGPGEYFGEMVLDEGPRSVSIMTLEPCRFLVVPKKNFRDFVTNSPAFALSLIEKLIGRVRALTESVKSLALMDVYGRVARLLLELAEEKDGTLVIAQRLTQQEIASRIGASREMVSRILKDLATGGYLTQSRSGIVLHRKPPEHW